MNKILGKTNGIELELHVKCVAEVAEKMCLEIFTNDFNREFKEKIKLSALLHDIGKSVKEYQDFFNGKKINNLSLLHNEIGWAILKVLGIDENILNVVYWHHGKPFYNKKNENNTNLQSILKKVSNDDLKTVLDFYSYITKKEHNFEEVLESVEKYKELDNPIPSYYKKSHEENILYVSYRSIIISSDRLVSSLNREELNRIINNDEDFIKSLILEVREEIKYEIPSEYNLTRFQKQEEIINQTLDNKTSIIKAPAGFGKTMLGLLWNFKSDKKLIWVCPRNVVVETVYNSIIKELGSLGLENKLSVELYITGERKKCNNSKIEEYNSDILITNIDNYLNVVTNNKSSNKAYSILYRDVVFDEFHEFNNRSALFACFVELMKVRHRFTNSKTLLLSASPNLLNHMWEGINNKTQILPSLTEHYSAVHDKNYKINIIEEDDVVAESDTLLICNSIFHSQEFKRDQNFDLLIHSKFIEDDKKNIFSKIIEYYDINNELNEFKPSVVAAPIIQASMDISFKHLIEYVISPDTTMQRPGRCNRGGKLDDCTLSFILSSKSNSENVAVNKLYNKTLKEKWCDYLRVNLTEYITLNDLYKIYNRFNIENEVDIKKYNNKTLEESLNNLVKIEPIRDSKIKKEVDKERLSSRDNLRTNGYNYYVTYRVNGSDEFTEPFTETIKISRSIDHSEDNRTQNKISKTIKKLMKHKTFQFKKHDIKSPLETLFFNAYRKETPYISFKKEYSKEFGLANIKIYGK